MKIDKTSAAIPASQVGESTGRHAAARQTGPAAPQSEGTSVHLGSSSAQLRSLESSMATAPAMDMNKVAEIKQAISEGRFQVNSNAVADGLLNTVRDLIATSQR